MPRAINLRSRQRTRNTDDQRVRASGVTVATPRAAQTRWVPSVSCRIFRLVVNYASDLHHRKIKACRTSTRGVSSCPTQCSDSPPRGSAPRTPIRNRIPVQLPCRADLGCEARVSNKSAEHRRARHRRTRYSPVLIALASCVPIEEDDVLMIVGHAVSSAIGAVSAGDSAAERQSATARRSETVT